jgi:hypothetical protein
MRCADAGRASQAGGVVGVGGPLVRPSSSCGYGRRGRRGGRGMASPRGSGDASLALFGAWSLSLAASASSACKLLSADNAATGCPVARTVPHATGSSIQTGISCRRVTGASTSEQRAAAPVARAMTSSRRTERPAQGCQA